MSDISRILSAIDAGDPSAASQLLPLVYDELRKLAAARLTRESAGQTLQATALVHEAYLRLVGAAEQAQPWENRGHFFAAAAQAMRRILVENARHKGRLKQGGEWERVDFADMDVAEPAPREDLLALDAALEQFRLVDATAAELVELRFFAGLTLVEAAKTLGISPRTADRTWVYAKAWLHRELQKDLGGTP